MYRKKSTTPAIKIPTEMRLKRSACVMQRAYTIRWKMKRKPKRATLREFERPTSPRLRRASGISLVEKHEFSRLGAGVRFPHPAQTDAKSRDWDASHLRQRYFLCVKQRGFSTISIFFSKRCTVTLWIKAHIST